MSTGLDTAIEGQKEENISQNSHSDYIHIQATTIG